MSMRGNDEQQEQIFSYVGLEERIPAEHPLRAIRAMVDAVLREPHLHFAALYARRGRPSIPPDHLVRALLLMILHSIRGERQLMEHIHYNLAYCWFVGLGIGDGVWDATVFTKNRERLMQGAVTERLFEAVLGQALEWGLLSGEHYGGRHADTGLGAPRQLSSEGRAAEPGPGRWTGRGSSVAGHA